MLDLEFNTANFTNVRVSEQLESLLAPAALPRLPFQAELLTAIRGVSDPPVCVGGLGHAEACSRPSAGHPFSSAAAWGLMHSR